MPFLSAAAAAGGLLFAPMAAQNALATIATVGATRLEAEYEAITPVPWVGRHKTASATLTADISTTRYRIAIDSRAEGFVDWFVDSSVAMVSTGIVTPRGLIPLRFDSSVQDGSKHRRVLVDFTPGEVLVSVSPKFSDWGFPTPSAAQKLEAVDPLTSVLGLTLRLRATRTNPCGGPLRIFDGKQRYDIRLTFDARLNWNTDVYKGSALKCDVDYIEIAGFDAKSAKEKAADRADIKWANFILAEIDGGELTPILKAELRSNRSGKYTFQATKLSYGRAR
jgi:Protein of unknown function (DUF3108)